MLPYKWKGIVREIDLYQKARAHNTVNLFLTWISSVTISSSTEAILAARDQKVA